MLYCIPYQGNAKYYQSAARSVLSRKVEFTIPGLVWVTTTCPTQLCLNPRHLKGNEPKKLNYPEGICVYCGILATTRDHLYPVTFTGEARRKYVLTVPSCLQCNSTLSYLFFETVRERRQYVHQRYRIKYRKLINMPEHSASELSSLGYSLRTSVETAMADKDKVLARLAWPTLIDYDRRAYENSDEQL